MKVGRVRVRYTLFAVSTLFVLILAACGGGDDDATATPAAANTPAAAAATPTQPTAAGTPDPGTPEATATVAAATPTTAPASPPAVTPTVAATPTERAATPTTQAVAPTMTPGVGATATIDPEDPFADIEMLDPELLPNFTMSFRLSATGISEEEDLESMILEIQQSEIDNYHMRFEGDGVVVEAWQIDGISYLRQDDGSILEVPAEAGAGFFSPSMFLTVMPALDPELRAARVGEETVNGRQTTHYRITGADYLALSEFFGTGEVPSDISGDVNVWIDNELNIMIRQNADITWTNADGTQGNFDAEYEIRDIGTTPRVEAPQ
jgi:hypothetical protein